MYSDSTTTLPHIERLGWLVSVSLHTMLTLGFVGLAQELTIDATDPFRLELVLVEQAATVPTVVETIVGNVPTHRDSSNQTTEGPRDLAHRPVGVQAPQPVIESKVIEPELQEQPILKNPENPVGVNTEPVAPVVEQLQPTEPEQPSSVPSVVPQSSVVTQPEVAPDEAETRAESDLKLPTISSSIPIDSHDEKDKEIPVITNRASDLDMPQPSVPAQSAVLADAVETQAPTVNANSPPQSTKTTRPDYSWLTRLLWERIDRIKQYSKDAVQHEWEGRVVILVSIREDGWIDDVSVAESSGNRSLDHEAVKLITQVSHLSLDRPLGAQRVKVRVPISFSLKRGRQ